MVRLVQSDHKANGIYDTILYIVTSLILTCGAVVCMSDILGFNWNIREILKGSYKGGAVKTWNLIADTMGNQSYTLLTKYLGEGAENGLFMTVMAALIFLLTLAIVRLKNKWFLSIYIVPVVILPIIMKSGPKPLNLVLLCGGLILAYIYYRLDGRLSSWSIVYTAIVMAIVFFVMSLPFIWGNLAYNSHVANLDKKIEELSETVRYGKNPLGDGRMDLADRTLDKKTALKVTMEKPDSLYLRGYVGEKFTDGKWESLAPTSHYNRIDLTRWLKEWNFSNLNQLETVSRLIGDHSEDVTEARFDVEVEKASSKYIYMPYEMADTHVEGTKNWGDSFLTGEGLTGKHDYGYKVVSNKEDHWTDIVGKLFANAVESDELKQYYRAESYNNVDIYKKYTSLSMGDVETLRNEIGEPGNQEKGHISYKLAIEKINTYMKDKILYSEKGIKNKEGESLKGFFKSHKGFDIHYASAATLMFRYYGIPARYVEGYIITPENKEKMKKGTSFEIPLKNAHAWTEIYIDAMGWVPIETVPKYQKLMKQADLTVGLENDVKLNPFDMNDDGGADNNEEKKIQRPVPPAQEALNIVAIIIMAILLLLLLYLLYRYLKKKRADYLRNKAFMQEDVKMAICAIYGYMNQLKADCSQPVREVGDKAAYSLHPNTEIERKYMLSMLNVLKKELRENEKKNSKLNILRSYIRHGAGKLWRRLIGKAIKAA